MSWLEFEQIKQAWLLRKFAPEAHHAYLPWMKYVLLIPGR